MIRKNTKFKRTTKKEPSRTFFTRMPSSCVSASFQITTNNAIGRYSNVASSIKGSTIVSTNNFSEEENTKIQNIRARMLSRMESRPKGSIAVNNNWIIDDSELSYIEVPARKSSFHFKTITRNQLLK